MEGDWNVQGARGTNPLKAKKKIKTTSKPSDAHHLPMVKVDEKPAFVTNCMKIMNLAVVLANVSSRGAKTAVKKSEDDRYNLYRLKLYLNSCANYHSFLAKDFLTDIKDGDTTLTGSCDAGTTVTDARGCWDDFKA